jgi:hypothetical protein
VRNIPAAVILFAICPLLVAQQPQTLPEAAAAPKAPVNSSTAVTTPNTLLGGTPIKLRLGRNISSADAKVGDHVYFEVLEDTQVMGVVVIAKGASAFATVTAAQPKRRMGREGKLDMILDYVRLADNEKAALTATAGGKGGTHTTVMVSAMAATALFTVGLGAPFFLLMHGKDITIPQGTEMTAYINGDMQLDMAKFAGGSAASAQTQGSAAPAAATQASLAIDSTPAGADVEIDGAFVGDTPSSISVASGSHQIAVKKKGFTNWTKTLNVTGGTIHLNAELERAPAGQ